MVDKLGRNFHLLVRVNEIQKTTHKIMMRARNSRRWKEFMVSLNKRNLDREFLNIMMNLSNDLK